MDLVDYNLTVNELFIDLIELILFSMNYNLDFLKIKIKNN